MNKETFRPWQVLRRETVYDSQWVRLHRDDVRLPDGTVIAGHHVVDFPRPVVGVVPLNDAGEILLIEHYRFITDSLGWEIPSGRVDAGEAPLDAAHRELYEETGYTARNLTSLGFYYPTNGSTNHTFHIYIGRGLQRVSELADTNEVIRVAWFSPAEVWAMISANQIRNGLSLTALLWHFARSAHPNDETEEDDWLA